MKILIAFDDSPCSQLIFHDLLRAGIPDSAEVLVLTVAGNELASEPGVMFAGYPDEVSFLQNSSRSIADSAVSRLSYEHPNWNVLAEIAEGSVASTIVERASRCSADLLIVSSHGRGMFGRMFLGSISLGVLHRADCSVRIVRQSDPTLSTGSSFDLPVQIMLAYDRSSCSDAAFASILARDWPAKSKLHIAACVEPLISSSYSYGGFGSDRVMMDAEEERRVWLEERIASIKIRVGEKFGRVTTSVTFGVARDTLLAESVECKADMIFLGAHGRMGVEGLLIGSVSQFIASHAPCTVEVVK